MTLTAPQAPVPAAATRAGVPPRVFVGLKIAPEIAAQLAEFAVGLERPFARPVAVADIHLTLVPPWNEASTADAIDKLGRVAAGFDAFGLTIQHVGYGRNRDDRALSGPTARRLLKSPPCTRRSLQPLGRPTSGGFSRT